MKISAYQNDIVAPMFRNAKLNLDLASKVLLSKQQQFDQTYQSLQNLKRDSLSIKFINKESQNKIDQYNDQILKDFPEISGGNFDLSNSQITERYMDNFRKIANDTQLIKNYKKDVQVQKSLQELNQRKNQKDPLKAGYHPINEANFLNQVQSYIDAKGDLSEQKVSYTPYIDTAKEMAVLTKTIPKEKNQTFQITEDGSGMIKITKEGKSPDAIRAASQKYHLGRGHGQMREEAKYAYNQIKDNDAKKQEIQDNYNDVIVKKISDNERQIEELRSYKPKTDEEQMQVAGQIANLEQINGQLENKQEQLLDPANFRDDENWINWMTDLYTTQAIENDVNTYGRFSTSYEFQENPIYTNMKNWELKTRDLDIKQGKLDLETLKFASEQESSSTGSSSTGGTLDDLINAGDVAGGYYENKTEKGTPTDGFVDGLFEHIDDIEYKSRNPFETGVSGEYELTKSEQIEYDKLGKQIIELEESKGEQKLPLEKALKNDYTLVVSVGTFSTKRSTDNLGKEIQDKIDSTREKITNIKEGTELNYKENIHPSGFKHLIRGASFDSLILAEKYYKTNNPDYAEKVRTEINSRNKQTNNLRDKLISYQEDLNVFNKSKDGYVVSTPVLSKRELSNIDDKISKLKQQQEQYTNVSTLSGEEMLDMVMDTDSWREFKKNEYLADNVYIRAARDIIKKNRSISKEDLKSQVNKVVNTPGNKYYDELVRQKRSKQHHEYFFRDITNKEDLKLILNNHNVISYYTPYSVDMRDAAVGNEQKLARQKIKRSGLKSLATVLVGGEDLLDISDISPEAVVGYKIYKGNIELQIDHTKLPGYDKEETNKWNYMIGDKSFVLTERDNIMKFYDASLDKDLSSDLILGIPTDEPVKFSDYSSLKGREFELYTEDNVLYDIVLIENGKEISRIENKRVPAEALIQAGDSWAKGGQLSF